MKMHFYLMVPLVLFITSVSTGMGASPTNDCNESPLMPNIGYLFQGYDIYKGNPLQEDTLHFDPGLRQPIFKTTYGNKCTSDRRYRIPEGTTVLDCSGCSLSFSTKQVKDMGSYRDSLSLKVSAEGGGWGAAFSASYGHKNVESKTQKSDHIFTHSEATCCSYKAQMLSYMLPSFSDDFKTAIEKLPETYKTDVEKKQYQDIIDTFGTHYIDQISMGSLFGQESEISSEDFESMQDSGMNINAAASYSGFDVTASAKFAYKTKSDAAHEFQQKSSHQRVYTVGPPPPEGNDMGAWIQEANKSPGPISQKLKSIISLLELQHNLNISKTVMENLNNSFKKYCEYLSEKGLVANCDTKVPVCRTTYSRMTFTCPRGTAVHITSAVWGSNVKPCSDGRSTTQKAREQCDGKHICLLDKNSNLQVPKNCPDGWMLHVCNTCLPIPAVPNCQSTGGIDIGIKCIFGTTINITYAVYYAPLENTCPGNVTTATELAYSFCKGKNDCDLTPTNAMIANPCPGHSTMEFSVCYTCIV